MAVQGLVSLPTQQRQGSFQTGSYSIPVSTPNGEILVTPVIDAGDFSDPLNSVWIRLYWLDGALWRYFTGVEWRGGGNPNDPEQQPTMGVNVADVRGKQVRAEIDIPRRMRCGVTVTLVTP